MEVRLCGVSIMPKYIKLLMVDDDENMVFMANQMLEKLSGGESKFHIDHCNTVAEALVYLAEKTPDAVLLNLGLPDSQGLETLDRILGVAAHLPIVVLTASADEELGIKALQRGAQDYLVKDQVNSRLLSRSLRHSIERHILVQEVINLRKLQKIISRDKILKGFLPICAHCKKIRNDAGYWQHVEKFISDHSKAKLSHGICPECLKEHYPMFHSKDENEDESSK